MCMKVFQEAPMEWTRIIIIMTGYLLMSLQQVKVIQINILIGNKK